MKLRYLLLPALLLPQLALAADPPPISRFTEQIIDRAFVGTQYVEGIAEIDNCEDFGVKDNALMLAGTYIGTFIDTDTLLTRQAESLKSMTVCQRYDLYLIERQLRSMQDRIGELANSCNVVGLKTLAQVHQFLAEGYKSVMQGGLDPIYTDFRLRPGYFWFGDQPSPEAEVCPFTTDYAVPAIVKQDDEVWSYGCDIEKLDFILDQDIPETLRSEAEQERVKKEKAESVSQVLFDQLFQFEQIFADLLRQIRGPDANVPTPPEQVFSNGHRVIQGCRENTDEILKVSTWNREDIPVGVGLTPTYDGFSIYKNAFAILRDFTRARSTFGSERPLPEWINTQTGTFVPMFPNAGFMDGWRGATAEQDRRSAILKAANADAVQKMLDIAKPLRSAVLKFGYISSFPKPDSEEKIPFFASYVRDVAYFLRRSCIYSACTPLLDNILRRTVDPSCFPYGSQQDIRCAHYKCLDLERPDECPADEWNP